VTRRKLLRRLATTFVLFSIALLAVACSQGADSATDAGDGVVITRPDDSNEASPAEAQPTEEPGDGAPVSSTDEPASSTLTGFTFPIEGGCLPVGDQLMPNAPRTYRNGTHEGVDLYNVDNCTLIGKGTPVLAAKDGIVIRADLDYTDLTMERYQEISADITSAEALDEFRGRQVWIDHGNGIVTRYCHLSGIAGGITQGATVSAGDVIAFVGESGTPESITNPGNEYHLHFEVRVGDSFLGAGLPPGEVRALYLDLFGQ
jgi:murein DD-endopeptidase MepM/ murein hydrolase activator NlpD